MTSSGYPLLKNRFLICSNSLLILLSEQLLNVKHLIRFTFLDLGAKASQLIYKSVNVDFLYIQVKKADEQGSTNRSKNGNLLSFSSSMIKIEGGCKSLKQWKNNKASLRELKQANVSSTASRRFLWQRNYFEVANGLKRNSDILLISLDKGSGVVILNRIYYIRKIATIWMILPNF